MIRAHGAIAQVTTGSRCAGALSRLGEVFDSLYEQGEERDRAGIRTLHYRDHRLLILLALFSSL